MRYELSQAELIEAVQYYMNEKVLARPVTVKSVEPLKDATSNSYGSLNYVLHVVIEDDQSHMVKAP